MNIRINFFQLPFHYTLIGVFLCSIFIATPTLQAQTNADAIRTWEHLYSNALKDLQFGRTMDKIRAAYILGAQSNPRFVRPLLAELMKGLDTGYIPIGTPEGPYVKSIIAGAIGSIGHEVAIPTLLKALELSVGIAQKKRKQKNEIDQKTLTWSRQMRKKSPTASQEKDIKQPEGSIPKGDTTLMNDPDYVTIDPDRPGPFLKKTSKFHYTPDQYWSIADSLKANNADSYYETYAARKFGANHWNLVRAIFNAIGKIGSEKSTQKLATYLDNQKYLPIIRIFASDALGESRNKQNIELLAKKFESEEDTKVKLAMAYSILRNDKTRSSMYYLLIRYLENGSVAERLKVATALRNLAMGESLENLRNAYLIEDNMLIRKALKDAIRKVERDTILPTNLR